MKKFSLFGMILYGLSGVISLGLGLYSLPPSKGMSGVSPGTGMIGGSTLTAWASISLGAVLLGMLVVMRSITSPRLVRWNATIMGAFGVLMLTLMPIMNMPVSQTPSLVMAILGGLMLATSLAINVIANPIGKPRACPECGSRVVTWSKKGMTYCTSCEWYFGAIPNSTSIMVCGDSGVGKTMLILKLIDVFQPRGKKCVFVGYDQPPAVTKSTIEEVHHGLNHIAGRNFPSSQGLIMVDAFSSTASLKSDEQYHTDHAFDLNEINLLLADLSKTIEGGIGVIIDSVNPLFLHKDASSVLKFLDYCRAKLIGKGGLFVFSITEGTLEESVQRKLESIVDAVIEIKFADEHAHIRRFRLRKMRGRNFFDEWVYFEILPKEGMVFQPIKKETLAA